MHSLNNIISQRVQWLANQIFERDPNAKVELKNPAIKFIQNSHETPVADLFIETQGKKFAYSITFQPFTQELLKHPIVVL